MSSRRVSVRGLSSTLPGGLGAGAVAANPLHSDPESGQFRNVPLDLISPNPDQPRKRFDPEKLAELVESVKERGVLQPVIVKPMGEGLFLLVAGERRFRAAREAGLSTIPAMVNTGDEQELGLIENVQRENLTPVEEAFALEQLAQRARYTQDALARVVGKSRQAVGDSLALLSLPEPILEDCRSTGIGSKTQLLHIVRESDTEKQTVMWRAVKAGEMNAGDLRRARAKKPARGARGRPKHFQCAFDLPDAKARVVVRFAKAKASSADVKTALELALKEHRRAASGKRR